MKIFSSLLALTALTLGLLSCGKDDDEPTPTTTNADLISASAWVHESSGVDQDKNGTIDVPLTLLGVQSCDLDNKLTFKKDGTAVADEGASVCSGNPQTTNFNWNFADNEKSLVIKNNPFAALNGKFSIKELTTTKLTVTKDTTITTPFPGTFTIIVNLKH